jgi:phage-related tail fiber protein
MDLSTSPNTVAGQHADSIPGPASKWQAADANGPQNEIVNTILAAGLVPDTGNLAQLNQALAILISQKSTPVGGGMIWTTATPPLGWFEMDGAAISRVVYAALFAVIGTSFGVGDGATTFELPDSLGEFLRFWDHGAGRDPDAGSRTDRGDGTVGDNVGTRQGEAALAHTHTIPLETTNDHAGGGVGVGDGTGSQGTITSGSFGANETRPRNVNFMGIIKY